MGINIKNLISMDEASKRLQVSKSALYHRLHNEDLIPVRPGWISSEQFNILSEGIVVHSPDSVKISYVADILKINKDIIRYRMKSLGIKTVSRGRITRGDSDKLLKWENKIKTPENFVIEPHEEFRQRMDKKIRVKTGDNDTEIGILRKKWQSENRKRLLIRAKSLYRKNT